MLPNDEMRMPENLPQMLAGTQHQAEKPQSPPWWPVYTATLLYVAVVILLLDWLTRYFRP